MTNGNRTAEPKRFSSGTRQTGRAFQFSPLKAADYSRFSACENAIDVGQNDAAGQRPAVVCLSISSLDEDRLPAAAVETASRVEAINSRAMDEGRAVNRTSIPVPSVRTSPGRCGRHLRPRSHHQNRSHDSRNDQLFHGVHGNLLRISFRIRGVQLLPPETSPSISITTARQREGNANSGCEVVRRS
jgi:hypothetical protein